MRSEGIGCNHGTVTPTAIVASVVTYPSPIFGYSLFGRSEMVLVWISRVLTSRDLSTYRKRLISPEKESESGT